MVLKILLTRKNAKIYFLTILLISALFALISTLNNYYIKINNENFIGSYIFIPDTIEINDFFDRLIAERIYVKKESDNNNTAFFSINNDMPDNTITINPQNNRLLTQYNLNINTTINIDENCNENLIYLNAKTYEELNINEINGYYITLSDWSHIDNILNEYSKENINIEVRYSNKYDKQILAITKLLKIFVFIIKLLCLITYIFILIDLFIDGKKKEKLFYTLGTKHSYILKLNIIVFLIFILEAIMCYYVLFTLLSIIK